MLSSLIIDTNIVIVSINQKINLLKTLRKLTRSIYISAITIAELFAIAGISTDEEKHIKKILKNIKVIPVNYPIAFRSALLARTRPSRQRRSDLIIAATALTRKSALATFNIRDFANIPDLKILQKEKLGL